MNKQLEFDFIIKPEVDKIENRMRAVFNVHDDVDIEWLAKLYRDCRKRDKGEL